MDPNVYDSFEWLANLFKRMQEEETGVPVTTVTRFEEEREKLLKKNESEQS